MKPKRIGIGTGYIILLLVCAVSGMAFGVAKPTTETETCSTDECHTSFAKKKVVHGPVEEGECESCHEAVDIAKHTWKMTEEGSELCNSCHDDVLDKANVHEPVKEGDCSICHDPHSSDHKFLLSSSKTSDVCLECHTITEGMAYLHGPVAVGECSVCHTAHSSDHKYLLTVEMKDLCFSCHEITKNELDKFEFVHEPVKEDCIGCHSPHGANNNKMLLGESPEMCYACHEDIKEIAENSKVKHSVVNSQGGCLKCHTPHASTVKYNLKSDPISLCMTCHDKPVDISGGKELGAFGEEIENKKFLHGPVEEKDCKGCHMAHGSDHFRLLEKDYPPQFYASYNSDNYGLCFSCHEDSLTQDAETTTLTDFRNGSTNMHYLHVNKGRRGRTCRSCHQTHASNLPKHIRASVPYGKWDLPVNFSKTETGGSCAPGCHRAKDYDRKVPVDYAAEMGKFKPQKKAKEESGGENEITEKQDNNQS